LKTLIDKYINRKGEKLFACFIDLRKAFDTVIHAGIRYKLIKYGISGKLYSIIKDMYRKNELCVRINNKITPTFKSFVGVKRGRLITPTVITPTVISPTLITPTVITPTLINTPTMHPGCIIISYLIATPNNYRIIARSGY
jgi:hypothetical protein